MRHTPGRTTPATTKLVLAASVMLLLQACASHTSPPEDMTVAPANGPSVNDAGGLTGRMIADANEYPWSAIGRVNIAGHTFCNGIMITPRHVLTYARCLYNGAEARWYQPAELHFLAGYQKDRYLADSKISSFTPATSFNPRGGVSLTNVTSNWALVTLREPIGHTTGWLSLEWDDGSVKSAVQRGKAATLRAGYRSDWPHAVSLHFGCNEPNAGLRLCDPSATELSLPTFVARDGELRLLANVFVATPKQGGELASLLAASVNGNRLGSAQKPRSGPADSEPRETVALLLRSLRYPAADDNPQTAAAAFRRDHGLPPSGTIDISLLTALINQAQRSGR